MQYWVSPVPSSETGRDLEVERLPSHEDLLSSLEVAQCLIEAFHLVQHSPEARLFRCCQRRPY